MKFLLFLLIYCMLICSCTYPHEIVPVSYIDYDYSNGCLIGRYFFEGELHGGDDMFKGYVSVKKFLGKAPIDPSISYNWYQGYVSEGFYSIMFPEGEGVYIINGRGDGKHGISVYPSWLPSIDKVINTIQSKK